MKLLPEKNVSNVENTILLSIFTHVIPPYIMILVLVTTGFP